MTAATNEEAQDGLTRARLDAILAAVGEQAALDVRDATLVKFTNNAVFRLSHTPVVVRIAGSGTMRSRLPKVIGVARWLAEHDMPAVRLVDDLPQPVIAKGHHATLWHDVAPIGRKPQGRDLAAILKRFHALPAPSWDLPPWKPFDEIRQRLHEADGVEPSDLVLMHKACDDLEERLNELDFGLPPGPIHGDAFMGNLIPGDDRPIICDFDSSATGPREWDLTPVAVGNLRFDYADNAQDDLVRHYGFDVTAWPGFGLLRQIRELKLVTSVVPILRSNPRIRDQWLHRLRTFKNGDSSTKWTTYT